MARLLNALKSISVEPVMLINGACSLAMRLFAENVQMNKICFVNLGFTAKVCENLADHLRENVSVQKEFSLFTFYNSIILSITTLMFVLFMGAWSDKYGRKIPLLFTLVCQGMCVAGYLLSNWQTSWPVEIIYLVTFLESAGGGYAGFLSLTTSYISDICPEESRTSRLSFANSMWYLGGPLGTLIGAVIIKYTTYNVALTLVLLAYISVVVYVIFFIKESHRPFATMELQNNGTNEQVTISRIIKDFFNWRRVVESFKTALKKREGNTRCVLLIIIVSNMIRHAGRGFFMYMFVRKALHWNATDYGYWFTYRSLMTALGSLLLITPLTRLYDIKDTTLVFVGSLSTISEYVCYGLVMNKSLSFLVWLGPVAGLLCNASLIAFGSIPTKLVGSNEKGRVSAAVSAMISFMPMVGYAIYSPVYYSTVDSFPSAQFFIAGSLNLLIIVMFGNLLSIIIVVSAVSSNTLAKIFEKCELAALLENKHKMSRDDVKSWVCIAQYESTFNTEAINHANWDGSKDYGLFQLNNKYWCGDDHGKNECKMPCSDLLDDDLTDDLACIKKIIKDTEAWKGKGTGLSAWVAYVNRCENRNLDEYMAECWSDPIESNIINTKDEEEESTQEPEAVTENGDASGAADNGDSPIINLVRVPIMLQKFPYFQHLVNPYGYVYQLRYQ